jgi:Transcriptional regulator, AbiEi antitoxin, Type IV TA system/Transcriptional regulator, AbiEi antitoxin N-terminal domain
MNSQKDKKLNYLLRHWPKGTVATQHWLNSIGIYRQLADRYCQSEWLKRIGSGAYTLIDDPVYWLGAVYSLEKQLNYRIYIGAKAALILQGHTHNIQLSKNEVIWLFKLPNEIRKLPKWFQLNFMHQYKIHYLNQDLFYPTGALIGLTTVTLQSLLECSVASPERAIIECIDLLPKYFTPEDIQLLMQGMTTLRPQLLQSLLENCRSVKAKRLFLLFAEHERHAWFYKLNLQSISLGQGKRVIGRGGHYYPNYQISIPIKLEEHEGYVDIEK